MDDKQINNQASSDVPADNKVDDNKADVKPATDSPTTETSTINSSTDSSKTDMMTDPPTETPADTPLDPPADTPLDPPTETPLDPPTETPTETPADTPTGSPVTNTTATDSTATKSPINNTPSETPVSVPATDAIVGDGPDAATPAAYTPVIEPPTEETTSITESAKMSTSDNITGDPADDEQAKVTNTDFNGKRILLVEDDEGLAEVYTTRLDVEGFKVKRVPNGEDALAATIEFKPDLILLDVMMPKVSGFEVLDILRNTPSTAKVKIIMLTALSQESDREKAQSMGVDDYLVKSQVVIADVVDRIKNALSK